MMIHTMALVLTRVVIYIHRPRVGLKKSDQSSFGRVSRSRLFVPPGQSLEFRVRSEV